NRQYGKGYTVFGSSFRGCSGCILSFSFGGDDAGVRWASPPEADCEVSGAPPFTARLTCDRPEGGGAGGGGRCASISLFRACSARIWSTSSKTLSDSSRSAHSSITYRLSRQRLQ